MFLQEHRRWKLMVAILTLSLLTVMAGAAVAPALGVISIIPVALWMPNERIIEAGQQKKSAGVFRNYYPFIVGMFFQMVIFFNYPANFAMESSRLGTVSEAAIPVIMALGDVFGFLGGLAYPKLKKGLGRGTKVVAPLMFLVGYLLLQFLNAMPGTLLGSFLIGAANGIGVPYFISTASAKAGRNAAITVIPALSVALYIAQFTTPAIVTVCEKILGSVIANVTSYHVAILLSLLFTLWCVLVVDRKPAK